jgi:hypothetical protein
MGSCIRDGEKDRDLKFAFEPSTLIGALTGA